MKPVLLLDVVGLTFAHLGEDTPHLSRLAAEGFATPMRGVVPAVTCTAQSTMLTGLGPSGHGIVANGWYFRDLAQVWLWRQSNRLVRGEKVWETARRRDPACTTMNVFWWYAMYADVAWTMTPRPLYLADGRKLPGAYVWPPDLRERVAEALPTFPLFDFWGPKAGLKSSTWIADAAILGMKEKKPTILLAYLPHLDYDLQRHGPDGEHARRALREIDACAGRLVEAARAEGRAVLVVSEYGIEAVSGAVHVNRALRRADLLAVSPKLDGEDLDAGASEAFAVADHQIAHVYVKDRARIPEVQALLAGLDGVELALAGPDRARLDLDHERSGEIVLLAHRGRWFSYAFWLDDARAPDYARTVDIHSKPGYDPVELFLDPAKSALPLRIAGKLLRKKLGFRTVMDLIPLDDALVRGSHGRPPRAPEHGPVLISSERPRRDAHDLRDVRDLVLEAVFGAADR